MSKHRKLLDYMLLKKGDDNVPFDALCKMLIHYRFTERVRGDHHIFTRNGVDEIDNLQPLQSKAKPYQVRQVRSIILRYAIHTEG